MRRAQIKQPGEIVQARRRGVRVESYDKLSCGQAIEGLLQMCSSREELSQRCRKAAEELYCLESAVRSYDVLCRKMLEET